MIVICSMDIICLKCNRKGGFKTEKRLVEQHYRGKTLMVLTEVTICPDCDWYTIGPGQLDLLLKNTKELFSNIYQKD